jgi:hypothetical protein
MHLDAGAPAHELVVGTLVDILKTSPSADVVRENELEIGLAASDVVEQFFSARRGDQ